MSMTKVDFQYLMRLRLALVSLTSCTFLKVTSQGTLPRDRALRPPRLVQMRSDWLTLETGTRNQAAAPPATSRSERRVCQGAAGKFFCKGVYVRN